MAVKLRLRRMGKKRQPIYKVVAADSRSPRDGKFLESIGLYDPKTDPASVIIEEDRALYWLSVGAQPTHTVRNLLNRKGILLKRELLNKGLSEEEVSVKLDEWSKLHEAKAAEKSKKVASAKKGVDTPKETPKEVELPKEMAKEVEPPKETAEVVESPVETVKEVESPEETAKEVEIPKETAVEDPTEAEGTASKTSPEEKSTD